MYLVIICILCFKLKIIAKLEITPSFGKKRLKNEQAYLFQSVFILDGEWVAVFEGKKMTFGY